MKSLSFGSYGRSFAGSIGGYGGLEFGAVSTPTPPDPNGWTKSPPLGAAFIPGPTADVPGYPGWVRQIGSVKAAKSGDKWAWGMVVASIDGAQERWYVKYAATKPGFPKVPLPDTKMDDDKGGAAQPLTPLMRMQQALNMADATGADGRPLGIDGKAGPNTCWAAYKFAQEVNLPSQPTLGAAFFQFLSLPGTYSNLIGNSCAPHYVPWGKPEDTTPVIPDPVVPPVIPDPIYPPVGPGPTPVDVVTPDVPLPLEAGFPWWMGVLVAGTMIGTAYMAKKKKKR